MEEQERDKEEQKELEECCDAEMFKHDGIIEETSIIELNQSQITLD